MINDGIYDRGCGKGIANVQKRILCRTSSAADQPKEDILTWAGLSIYTYRARSDDHCCSRSVQSCALALVLVLMHLRR